MSENLQLSQPAWALLDTLQQQLGVTIEVFDLSLRPLGPGNGSERAGSAPASIAPEIQKALKSGELRIDRSTGAAIGIFPIRAARQIAGCIVVSPAPGRLADVQREPDGEIETAGHLARAAIEGDLSLIGQLADARHRARRVHAILRFLTQLGDTDTGDIMNAVVQAATVWFDVDCRIYERTPDGAYTLSAVLPGVDGRAVARIEAQRAEKLLASRRFSSGGDLDDLGLGGRQQEVVVLPVGRAVGPEWLLVLAGAIDHEVELTFSAIARVLAGELVARDAARLQRWQRLLADLLRSSGSAPERVLLTMLEGLAGELNLAMARVTLRAEGQERVLAALGPSQTPPPDAAPASNTQSFNICIGPDAHLTLTVASGVDARQTSQQASSWLTAIQPWLPNAIAQMSRREALFEAPPPVDESPFERRIQEEIERAKRFNLGLGLVLIGPGETRGTELDTLLSAIRGELRASDLMGRLRNGLVAVLLVHAEPIGTESVINRLRRRLGDTTDVAVSRFTQVGRAVFSADCASADALIAQAQREAQALESRN